MTTLDDPASDHAISLRAWASGAPALEAAVDLLLAAFNGRFAAPDQPWIRRDGDRPWLDVEALAAHLPGPWSSGERRVLQVVASLAGGHPVELSEVLWLDDDLAGLVLAALAHVAGIRP